MSERNNIDRLFQEKFKDFEVAPPDRVWSNIQSKMTKKDKKFNALPLFLILSGFAAVVVIGLSVTNTFRFNPFNFGSDTVQTEEINMNSATVAADDAIGTSSEENAISNDAISNEMTSGRDKADGSSVAPNSIGNPSETPAISGTAKSNIKETSINRNNRVQRSTNSTATQQVVSAPHKTSTSSPSESYITNKTGTVMEKSNEDKKINDGKPNSALTNESEPDWLYENSSQTKIAYETRNNRPKNSASKNETAIYRTDTQKQVRGSDKNTDVRNSKSNEVTFVSSSATDVVAKDSIALTPGQIVKVVATEETTEEKPREEKKKEHKIIVSSLVSPVYMNLNGYGSALDTKFNDNSKSYRTSLSYGVGIMYPINNKWSVRTGLNLLNFEYNTNNIVFYDSQNSTGLQYVNENNFGSSVTITNLDPKGIPVDGDDVVTKLHSGDINQRIGYVEIPMEVSYKLLNKRFSVDVIGGFSSMFLNENRVSLVAANTTSTIGQANNLNKVHFSSNVGLGLRYGFMKSFQANFEPMFKYQFNTFSNESGNFKPYFIGLYTGISYRF